MAHKGMSRKSCLRRSALFSLEFASSLKGSTSAWCGTIFTEFYNAKCKQRIRGIVLDGFTFSMSASEIDSFSSTFFFSSLTDDIVTFIERYRRKIECQLVLLCVESVLNEDSLQLGFLPLNLG